jgi:hypothetical protein
MIATSTLNDLAASGSQRVGFLVPIHRSATRSIALSVAESARAAHLALDVLQNALPGVIETVEKSTRLSVVERDVDGFIAKVTTSTLADLTE